MKKDIKLNDIGYYVNMPGDYTLKIIKVIVTGINIYTSLTENKVIDVDIIEVTKKKEKFKGQGINTYEFHTTIKQAEKEIKRWIKSRAQEKKNRIKGIKETIKYNQTLLKQLTK